MILRVEMRLAALRANRYSHMDIACMQNGGEGCWSAQPWVEHADDASYTLSMNRYIGRGIEFYVGLIFGFF